jgi:putative transposase
VIAAEDHAVQVACRVLGVSEAGFYEHRNRAPSERGVRHAMLTDLISQIHTESRGTYGARRVHAVLTLGRGVVVGHGQVELLMRRAGIQGISGRRKWKRIRADDISTDLVKRDFGRQGPNQLWVTDITEHPTREGKIYCCAILDAYSRRVVNEPERSSPREGLGCGITPAVSRRQRFGPGRRFLPWREALSWCRCDRRPGDLSSGSRAAALWRCRSAS